MTKFGKQHYTFTFRNPGDDSPITSWTDLFEVKKPEKDSPEVALGKIIGKDLKPFSKMENSSHDKLNLADRFISVVETFLNLK